jgi:hypothetical protein
VAASDIASTRSSEIKATDDDTRNKRERLGLQSRVSHVVSPQPKKVMMEVASKRIQDQEVRSSPFQAAKVGDRGSPQ